MTTERRRVLHCFCPDCTRYWNDDGYLPRSAEHLRQYRGVTICCPACNAARMDRIKARENLPVGGLSSPPEYEALPIGACGMFPYPRIREPGSCGGGRRVIRKSEPMGG